MKIINRTLLLLVSILSIQVLHAQPVFTSSINLTVGDSYRYDGYGEVTNVEPGFSGRDQMWDFAGITGNLVFTGTPNVCTLPSRTLFADSAAVANSDVCVVVTSPSGTTNYFFFINNNSSQVITASCSTTLQNDINYGHFNNGGVVQFEFPFTYASSFDYSYDVQYFNVTQSYHFLRDSSVVSVEADGYGTVVTPAGTWENVLRMKKTQHQYIWMKSQTEEEWISIGDHTIYEYRWMATGIKVPVMYLMNYAGTDEYTAHYLVDYNFTTGIDEKNSDKVAIYPNPVTNQLTISSDKPFCNIRFYAANGQLLENIKTEPAKNRTVDFSDYQKGIYLLKINFKNGSTLSKKIIK